MSTPSTVLGYEYSVRVNPHASLPRGESRRSRSIQEIWVPEFHVLLNSEYNGLISQAPRNDQNPMVPVVLSRKLVETVTKAAQLQLETEKALAASDKALRSFWSQKKIESTVEDSLGALALWTQDQN